MDTFQKNKKLLKFCKKFSYRQRLIFSDEGNLCSPGKIGTDYQKDRAMRKPDGLWYSFGSAWIEFLVGSDDLMTKAGAERATWASKRMAGYTHIYKLHLNRKLIYTINTLEKFIEFTHRYGTKNGDLIKWRKVGDDGYHGVEVRFFDELHDLDNGWYQGWDCSSGCIWSKGAVRKIELIKSWDRSWYASKSTRKKTIR